MTALRMIRHVGDKLGANLPVQTIFQAPTLAGFASLCSYYYCILFSSRRDGCCVLCRHSPVSV